MAHSLFDPPMLHISASLTDAPKDGGESGIVLVHTISHEYDVHEPLAIGFHCGPDLRLSSLLPGVHNANTFDRLVA